MRRAFHEEGKRGGLRTLSGNKIVVDGMRNNASGVLEVKMDDNAPFTTKLYSDDVICGVFFEYDVGNGTHIVTMTLLDDDTEGRAFQPVLHVTTITYVLSHYL